MSDPDRDHEPIPERTGMRGDGWPLGWPVIAALAVLAVILAILAARIGTLPGDLWVSTQLQRLHGQPWRALWHVGNAFGTSRWVIWIALASLVGSSLRREWRDVGLLLGVLVLRLAMLPLKGIVQSPRPTADQVHIVEPVAGYGFPSGHTLTATVVFGTIAVLIVRHLARPWAARAAVAIWIVGVTLTGFARIWSGAHWTSDVIGAALIGTIAVAIAARIPPPVARTDD
ncbi:MAG: phosphatase PAP2 family protein [Thermomicrobiales bacterium]